jgi:chemotaxis protein histidine kinase CheA
VNFARYLKKAFLYHWNLLVFIGGTGFAVLSGRPDVFVPLVLAGELGYLALLGSHPRFQKAVDAEAAQASRQEGTADAEAALRRILFALPPEAGRRYERLRERCRELRQIAAAIKGVDAEQTSQLEELQVSGLERLLWTFLRLLYTQHMLGRFFAATDEAQIKRTIQSLEAEIGRHSGGADDPQQQKIRKALEDNLETSRTRLANLQKARDTSELIRLEIDRLENKIHSLSELAVNRREPEFVSSQVDQVAASMVQTERTMNELQFATGLASEEAVPQLIERTAIPAKG